MRISNVSVDQDDSEHSQSQSLSKSYKPTVIIYRNHLLRPSETFIREQVGHLKQFDYHYVCSRRVTGLDIPEKKVLSIYGRQLSQKIDELVFKTFGLAPRLLQQLTALNPALIHAHFGPDAIRASTLSQKLGIPLVVTFHGYGATVKPSHAWRSSYTQLIYLLKKKQLKSEATHFIAVSNFVKHLLIEQGFPKEKISTHYIGIDTEKFSPDNSVAREETVLFVGRLIEVKGCEYLIEAMAAVQAHRKNVKLIVIGEGPAKEKLEVYASKTLKRVQFLGYQPSLVVREWMNKSKVFCVPSVTTQSGHAEAFGTVFTEAQSMGLPVVSFDSGGISEAVSHGKTGFLVSEKDVNALAERIVQVLRDSAIWNSLSEQAIKRTRAEFDIVQQTRKLEDLYTRLTTR